MYKIFTLLTRTNKKILLQTILDFNEMYLRTFKNDVDVKTLNVNMSRLTFLRLQALTRYS